MSFFLVGGGADDGLGEVYDEFIAEARSHSGHPGGQDAGPGRIAVVVAGPAEVSGDQAAALTQIVTSRWSEADVLPIHLSGPGTSPTPQSEAPEDTADTGTSGTVPGWAEDPGFALPEGLDTLDGIIVGGGRVASYIAGLGPAADLLSRLVRGGAPWLGFSAGAMVTAVAAVQSGWRLDGRQIAPQAASEGSEELTIDEGLGLVSITSYAHNDVLSADGLLISAVDAGLLRSAVAIDEGTCLKVQQASGRATVMGGGLVRWFTKDPAGVVVRSERSPRLPSAPAPTPPKFAGLAQVAAATRAAHKKEAGDDVGASPDAPARASVEEPSSSTPAAPSAEDAAALEAGQTGPVAGQTGPEATGTPRKASGEDDSGQERPAKKPATRKRSTTAKTTTRRRASTKSTGKTSAKASSKTTGKTSTKTSSKTSAKEPAKRTRKTQKKTPTRADAADGAGPAPADPAQAES